jgi:hypothetical protein
MQAVAISVWQHLVRQPEGAEDGAADEAAVIDGALSIAFKTASDTPAFLSSMTASGDVSNLVGALCIIRMIVCSPMPDFAILITSALVSVRCASCATSESSGAENKTFRSITGFWANPVPQKKAAATRIVTFLASIAIGKLFTAVKSTLNPIQRANTTFVPCLLPLNGVSCFKSGTVDAKLLQLRGGFGGSGCVLLDLRHSR